MINELIKTYKLAGQGEKLIFSAFYFLLFFPPISSSECRPVIESVRFHLKAKYFLSFSMPFHGRMPAHVIIINVRAHSQYFLKIKHHFKLLVFSFNEKLRLQQLCNKRTVKTIIRLLQLFVTVSMYAY